MVMMAGFASCTFGLIVLTWHYIFNLLGIMPMEPKDEAFDISRPAPNIGRRWY